jgi:hypothetical protein
MVDLSQASWRKSVHSSDGACVEIAFVDDMVAVRDSKARTGPVLLFTPAEWEAFTAGVRDGEFDPPRHRR